MKKKKKAVFILTAFGVMIDTICEIHDTYESARDVIRDYVEDSNAYEEEICKNIWKTSSAGEDDIEWQIWKKMI